MVSLWVCAMLALCAQSYKLVYNYDYTNVSTLCFVPSVETPVAIQEQFSALRSLPALFTSKYYLLIHYSGMIALHSRQQGSLNHHLASSNS